jgi:hypothetical protein
MKSRTSAVATLVASLVLLLVTGVLWAGSATRGVGLDLPVAAAAGASADEAGAELDDPRAGATARGRGATTTLPSPQSVPLTDATRIEPLVEAEPPRRVSIPSVGVTMPIVATGVLDDGQMELPDDPAEIGWYRFGPGPGEPRGSVVLGGHVDSVRSGVGPLARLAAVEQGARITVTAADGSTVRYRVSSVERIRKAALPTERLFDPDSRPRLVVITCGGRYLPEAGGYEDNIVVIARPV